MKNVIGGKKHQGQQHGDHENIRDGGKRRLKFILITRRSHDPPEFRDVIEQHELFPGGAFAGIGPFIDDFPVLAPADVFKIAPAIGVGDVDKVFAFKCGMNDQGSLGVHDKRIAGFRQSAGKESGPRNHPHSPVH